MVLLKIIRSTMLKLSLLIFRIIQIIIAAWWRKESSTIKIEFCGTSVNTPKNTYRFISKKLYYSNENHFIFKNWWTNFSFKFYLKLSLVGALAEWMIGVSFLAFLGLYTYEFKKFEHIKVQLIRQNRPLCLREPLKSNVRFSVWLMKPKRSNRIY